MPCPLPRTDWSTVFMWGLLFSGFALTIGKVWGERVGRSEASAEAQGEGPPTE